MWIATLVGGGIHMKHLLSTKQIESLDRLYSLFVDANWLREGRWHFGQEVSNLARGRVLALVKDEGSTRTRVSFEVAMKRLGGEVVLLELDKNSSIAKGETLEDTIKTVSQYADAIVLRHSQRGAVENVAQLSDVPVINAGDGDGEHPTQALLDIYTIFRRVRKLDNLDVMFVGDLKSSRTVHSLLHLLALGENNSIHLVSPKDLKLPDEYDSLFPNKTTWDTELDVALEKYGKKLNVLYMTRFQRERYLSRDEVLKLTESGCNFGSAMCRLSGIVPSYYKLDEKCARLLGHGIVMHPLPRNEEIPKSFDNDLRAAYFDQVRNGMYVRMAMLANLFTRGSFFSV